MDVILEIKNLLYNKKYTIAGAISTLSNSHGKKIEIDTNSDILVEIVQELDEILAEITNSNK